MTKPTTKLGRVEMEGDLEGIEARAKKATCALGRELGWAHLGPSEKTAFGVFLKVVQREQARAIRECAAIAHDEAIQNKAAALRALTAGRPRVSEFRDSDGEACARVEAKILSLSTPRKRGER
jgi:hypothetical protein